MNIFLFPAILILRLARFVSGFVEFYINEKVGHWIFITFAFPFQRDNAFRTAFYVSVVAWGLLIWFVVSHLRWVS